MAFEPLEERTIEAGLSPHVRRWLRELRVHQEIDSTNTHLMERASSESIDGVVCFAESQTGGRGRRGRSWLTPVGRSIAVSIGKELSVPISQIGPLSLVVGIGVADALARIGVERVSLKWPNDILVGRAKAGGILIELAGIGQPLVVVIGIGLNVGSGDEVRERLGIPVGDIESKTGEVSRNELAAVLIDSVHAIISEFEQAGFEPLRARWEALHAFQDEMVVLVGANDTVEGKVRGVSAAGELILETANGVSHFSGGELSLRARSQ